MISFIVSTYNRPMHLMACLGSLKTQGSHEIILCDNGNNLGTKYFANMFDCRYIDTSKNDPQSCYHGLEVNPNGDFLCFPSEDSYYVPDFSRIMLETAIQGPYEFVYCDMLYDPRLAYSTKGVTDTYSVMITAPALGCIDKTNFIVSKRAFEQVGGWPSHHSDWRDGALAAKLIKEGISHGKAKGVMCVHN